MEQPLCLPQSKLTLPRQRETIRRERLENLLADITRRRLTLVTAGPGFGKTTLMAQAASILEMDTLWYRLEPSDADFSTFMRTFITGFRGYYDLGETTLARMKVSLVVQWERRAVLTAFLKEVEQNLRRDIMVVLDDYHCLEHSPEIDESLAFLLENMPPAMHLVIISRTQIKLKLSRLRARRELLEISERDLAFNVEETAWLFSSIFSIMLEEANLKRLHERTGGWVAGLILFQQSLKRKSTQEIQKLLSSLEGSPDLVVAYLEENAFDTLHDDMREFLCRTSILSRLNAEFCDKLLNIQVSHAMLATLEARHLFTFSDDAEAGWYNYHHLFREFLQNRLKTHLSGEVAELHRKAARLWEERGQEEEAIPHYLAGCELMQASRLISRLGRLKLLKEDRLRTIESFLKKIPESYIEQDPWMGLMQARVQELAGKPGEAISAYLTAKDGFSVQGATVEAGMCLRGLGYSYFIVGDFRRSHDALKELLPHVPGYSQVTLEIQAMLICLTAHLGHMDEAQAYYQKAVEAVRPGKDEALLGWVHFNQAFHLGVAGDFAGALTHGELARGILFKRGIMHILVMSHHIISWACYYLGDFDKGTLRAAEGLDIIKTTGIPNPAEGWLLMDLSLNRLGQGRNDEALCIAKAALTYFQELECRWGQAYVLHVLHLIHIAMSDPEVAEKCARSAVGVIEGLELPLEEGYFKAYLAGLLLDIGQSNRAYVLLETAEGLLQNTLLIIPVYFWQSRLLWMDGLTELALEKLYTGLSLCEAHRYDAWAVRLGSWLVPLLAYLHAQERMQSYIESLLEKMGEPERGELAALKRNGEIAIRKTAMRLFKGLALPAPPLRVCCLGEFKLYRGGEEIPAAAWKSKKAKMLFKFLVQARTQGFVSKDVLMESLWPESDPAKSIGRLHVALNALRKVLDSTSAKSAYLLRDAEGYRLDLGQGGSCDVDLFDDCIRRIRLEKDPVAIQKMCEKAAALYSGDYLEEDTYVDWFAPKREALKEDYLTVLRTLMDRYSEQGNYSRGIEVAHAYLQVDCCDEDVYRDLMFFYAMAGKRTMVAKTFERCRKEVLSGLDAPINRETEDLYRHLMSS